MLVVFLKVAILFISLLLVMRIMGKRQIGEMQPFELVIMLVIAEVASLPMNDPYIPLYYGIIPILTLCFLHLLISLITRKSIKARNIISGKSVIAIDKNGIRYDNLKKMNINTIDLLESVRAAGQPDFNSIAYAIFETNGKLCVIPKEEESKGERQAQLPITLLIDGNWNKTNLAMAGTTEESLEAVFKKNGYSRLKDILYADIRQDGLVFVNPKEGKFFIENLAITGGENW